MDESKLAQVALQFLSRTQLQGREAPDFIVVCQWLESKTQTPRPAQEGPQEG
jgi:hypothetical protein